MISIMLMRPRGLWPTPEHGKSLQTKPSDVAPVPGAASATSVPH
jgi:branched-chain amino acid transport system permease protein